MDHDAAPAVRIYSPGQVGLACFLGSPLAACCIMALTYGAVHEPIKAKRCLSYGAASACVIVALAFVLPSVMFSVGFVVGYTIILYLIAKRVQGPLIVARRAQDGIGSWGFVVGVGFLGFAVIFSITVGINFLLSV